MAQQAQYLGTGKRKTSVARVILRPGDGKTWFNGRTLEDYFPRMTHRMLALAPLKTAGVEGTSTSGSASTAADRPARPGRSATGSPARSSRRIRSCGSRSSARGSSRATLARSSARRPDCTKPAKLRSSRSANSLVRRYFGTDGVRGVFGEDLTVELVEQLGKAATLWSGRGRVFVGRDTRGSGPELEEAFARGVVAAGGNAVLAGVLPTPAVALLALDLGVVITASHNPPEYNGVKFFDSTGTS